MPQRVVSKIERPQELRQAVHLIVMFAIRKGGDLALEGKQPGGFLRRGYLPGIDLGRISGGSVRAKSFTLPKRQNRISRPFIFLHFSDSI